MICPRRQSSCRPIRVIDPYRSLKVVKAYPPGQQEIDGGGFEIKKVDPEKGYIYVQFESLKRGYIDDVEFLVKPADKESGQVLVRSASRLGYLDLGVNAKRLNRLSQALRDIPGWTAPKITQELFPRLAEFACKVGTSFHRDAKCSMPSNLHLDGGGAPVCPLL